MQILKLTKEETAYLNSLGFSREDRAAYIADIIKKQCISDEDKIEISKAIKKGGKSPYTCNCEIIGGITLNHGGLKIQTI